MAHSSISLRNELPQLHEQLQGRDVAFGIYLQRVVQGRKKEDDIFMTQSLPPITQSQAYPKEGKLPDQRLESMRAMAASMREEIRTLTQAIRINVHANPQWDRVAKTVASTKNPTLRTDSAERNLTELSACIATFEKKLQSRFGLKNPSQATEEFCKTILPRVQLWKQGVNQLWKPRQ